MHHDADANAARSLPWRSDPIFTQIIQCASTNHRTTKSTRLTILAQSIHLQSRRCIGTLCRNRSRPNAPIQRKSGNNTLKGSDMSDDQGDIILSELNDDDLVAQMFDDLYDGLKEEID